MVLTQLKNNSRSSLQPQVGILGYWWGATSQLSLSCHALAWLSATLVKHTGAHRHILPSDMSLHTSVQLPAITWPAEHGSWQVSSSFYVPVVCAQALWASQPCVVGLLRWRASCAAPTGTQQSPRNVSSAKQPARTKSLISGTGRVRDEGLSDALTSL